jgi:ribulose-phosphate 3-epimerase
MKTSAKIVPAILTDNRDSLISMVNLAKSFTDWVQIDFMDGHFVPSLSITPKEIADITPDITLEAHLRVNEPEKILNYIKKAGAERVIFHYEATGNPIRVIDVARSLQLGVGIAMNPSTPADVLINLACKIDCVLFMTVNPGYYGAKFIPEVLDKVKVFRQQYNEMEVGIDGGVKEENLKLVASSGTNSICVGSAIFLSKNPAQSYHRLSGIIRS